MTSPTSYSTFSSPDFLCIDDVQGLQHPPPQLTRVLRRPISVKYKSLICNASFRPTTIGAIIGGVVAALIVLVLAVMLVWYLKHRSRETSRRRRLSIMTSEAGVPALGAQPRLRMSIATTTQGLPSSHFYAPSLSYQPPQTGRTLAPEPSIPSYTTPNYTSTYTTSITGSNQSRASHTPSAFLSSSITPPSQAVKTGLSITPFRPEAQRSSLLNEKVPHEIHRYAVQNPTTPGPSSSFYNDIVTNYAPTQIPNEPVEDGLMSREVSTRSALPPYSPGELRHDTPLPGQ